MAKPGNASRTRQPNPTRTHVLYLLFILVVALIPRVLAMARTVAPSRDTFKFLSAAQAFEQMPFLDALRSIDVHPLYPITFLGARRLFTVVTGVDGPFAWLYSGQVFNVTCSLAFLALAYWAGVQIWNARIALVGSLAIAVIPRQVFYSADILADNLHAALWMASFSLLVWAWKQPSPGKLAWSAFLAGLAFWTRIEAVLLPMIFLCTLCVTQCVPDWRWPRRTAFYSLVAYVSIYSALLGGFVFLMGGLSPRNSAKAILGVQTQAEERVATATPLMQLAGADVLRDRRISVVPILPAEKSDGSPAGAVVRFGPDPDREGKTSFSLAVLRLLGELGQETRGLLLLLAVIALIDSRRSHALMPAGLLVFFALAGCAAMLVLLRLKAGYLAGRYMMPILPLLAMYSVTGAEALVFRIGQLPRLPWELSWDMQTLSRRRSAAVVATITVVGLLLCVPVWFKQLHRFRHGHMQAAHWLAEHADPDDLIFDPTHMSGFFSGRALWRPTSKVPDQLPVQYAVIDPTVIYRTDDLTYEAIRRVSESGRLVAEFSKTVDSKETGVYLFEMGTPAPEKLSERDSE